jgi:predicted ferric reductase
MSLEWMAIRGSGIVAFALLAGSTIWGLLISTKVLGRAVKAKGVTWFHESLALGSLVATTVHMFFLYNDDFLPFDYRELLIPGGTDWRPLAIAFGIVSFYAMFIVSISFYFKKWIGQDAWRLIHFASFGTFVSAALHGIFSGTDTGNPAVAAMYVGTIAVTGLLLVIRVAQASTPTKPARSVQRKSRTAPTTSDASPSQPEKATTAELAADATT